MKKILFTASLIASALFSNGQTKPPLKDAYIDVEPLPLPASFNFPVDPVTGSGWFLAPEGGATGKATYSYNAAKKLAITFSGIGQYDNLTYNINEAVNGIETYVNLSTGGFLAVKASAPGGNASLRVDFASQVAANGKPCLCPQWRVSNVGSSPRRMPINSDWVIISERDWLYGYQNSRIDSGKVDSSLINNLQFFVINSTAPATGYTGTITLDSMVISNNLSDLPTPLAVTSPLEMTSSKLYPNPAVESINVDYVIKSAATVKLVIYDMTGRAVTETTEQFKSAGFISDQLEVKSLEPGIYNVTFIVDGAVAKTERLIVK